jgi:flagellar biosynthesis chaperone FliJ
MFSLIFLRKNPNEDDQMETGQLNDNIESIIRSIEEISDEQRDLVKKFKLDMELFASERTLESCVQTLNQSMQLANIREQLVETYKQYCQLLENELKRALHKKP